jgi:tetratricopeptide (TPR) repeat protein
MDLIKSELYLERVNKVPKKYLTFAICFILALSTIVAYWQVHSCDFVNYDDNKYVTLNQNVQTGLTQQGIIWAFTTGYFGSWLPLTWLSHMLDCELFGLNPGRHHLTNLLLHIANTLLLFIVLKQMTGVLWQSAFVAAAFALHPMHVESVAWISERKDILSMLFWILTIAAYIRYVRQPGITCYLLTILTFAMGLMSKPTAVTLPFVLLLLDYWPLGRLTNPQTLKSSEKPSREISNSFFQWRVFYRLVLEKIPFFALSLISSIVTYFVQRTGKMVTEFGDLPVMSRIANTFLSYVKYIDKTIWPTRLAMFYPHPSLGRMSVWPVVYATLILLIISVCVLRLARSHKYLPVGWFWYLGTLVPMIGLVQVGSQAIADRYTYIPATGLFIMVAWGLPDFLAQWRYRTISLTAAAVVLTSAMMICTWRQVGHWQNTYALFTHALAATGNDNFTVHYMLGKELFEQKKFEDAIHHYEETLRLRPQHFGTLNNLAVAYYRVGKIDPALVSWNKALKINPNRPDVYYNMGVALTKQQKIDEAVQLFTHALRLNPALAEARKGLANAFFLQGRFAEAVQEYRLLIQIAPDSSDLCSRLAFALLEQGKIDEAVKYFEQALGLDPGNLELMNNLAWLIATHKSLASRDPEKAIRLATHACEFTGYQIPRFLDTLSVAYAAAGKFDQAVNFAEKALQFARSAKQDKLAADIQKRLNLYKAGSPYYEK